MAEAMKIAVTLPEFDSLVREIGKQILQKPAPTIGTRKRLTKRIAKPPSDS